ncbi:E3 ubiquitin-protein ligase listerin [Gracilariopsis chorda]|uniref:E3 ubiquitin-protein ligase listerin n=1 Tax=Gracilariopsis chorda TaxID=448386 RepID=A0A2V3IIK6_9FLOR|nr:E3 ubiquitin-protein ligase listerin [Gracilariopsis chorda]|eukprot:PXF41924.1 E3 ubiquitin-protein ligase listerin [Gracilariopsis chorda]
MEASLETMHTILLALHKRDAQKGRPSPNVNLTDQRRVLLTNVFLKSVAPSLTTTVSLRTKTKRTQERSQKGRVDSGDAEQTLNGLEVNDSGDILDLDRPLSVGTEKLCPGSLSRSRGVSFPEETESSLQTAPCGSKRSMRASSSRATKRPRKPTAPNEVRGERFRPLPSKNVLDRLKRSNLRLFLVDQHHIGSDNIRFAVMGTNGNIYHANMCLEPKCNCPDFTKRKQGGKPGPCKHLIFLFHRVFRIAVDDSIWWQIRLLPSELKQVLENMPQCDESVVADERVRALYHSTRNEETRNPVQGDCPVCFQDLKGADISRPEDVTTFCRACGKNFHKLCIEAYVRTKEKATCPACRKPVKVAENQAAGNAQGQYINLMKHSTAHERELTLAEMYVDSHAYIDRRRTLHKGRVLSRNP